MRFFNRKVEIGLNVLQLMSSKPDYIWKLAEICERLRESELFAYQVVRLLKEAGYVYSFRGNVDGGYHLHPQSLERTLKDFLESFNRQFGARPTMSLSFASEYANHLTIKFFMGLQLKHLFNPVRPSVIPFPTPPGVA